jgi:hypothetical protein
MPTDSIRANFPGWNSVSSVAYQKRKRDHPNNTERPEEDFVRGSAEATIELFILVPVTFIQL